MLCVALVLTDREWIIFGLTTLHSQENQGY
jgi:hypothetical protein